MNELKLIVELSTEDRARLDKIIDLLGHRPDCAGCVASVAETFDRATKILNGETAPKTEDDIAKKCKDTLKRVADPAEPAKNAQEAPTASDHPTLEPFPEVPTEKAEASEEPAKAKPAVTMEMLRSKAITLAAAGKKDQVRAVVHPYAAKVTDLPENVWAEVFEKLSALEG